MDKDLFIKPKDLSIKLRTQNNLKILDATFYLPDSDLIAKDEYDKKHIPNAVFFDERLVFIPIHQSITASHCNYMLKVLHKWNVNNS